MNQQAKKGVIEPRLPLHRGKGEYVSDVKNLLGWAPGFLHFSHEISDLSFCPFYLTPKVNYFQDKFFSEVK